MNSNPFVPQPNNTTLQMPLLPEERSPQMVHPDNPMFLAVNQHPQQSDFQAPLALADNPQRTQPMRGSPHEQSAFSTNEYYGSQWDGQQPQPQQQKRLHDTPPQDPFPRKHQRFSSPNVNSQPQHHAPPPPQPQVKHPLSPAENMDSGSGDRQGSQFDSGIRAHGSGGNFGQTTSMQAESHDTIPNSAEPAGAPMATQLQGAHHVNISGNSSLMNIGTNMGFLTTMNNYGGTHGLERLERSVSFAALHDSAEQDPDRLCYPGTRKTVLRQLRDWFDNPNPTDRIFWLYGPAGAGKSAIAQTIADERNEQEVAATFFFYRSDPSRNDGKRLFLTIVWQLAFSIPATKDYIVHALEKTPHLPTKRVETQFEQLVAHPFQAMNNTTSRIPQPAPVVIIDGVDECSDEQLQRRILTVIGNAVKDRRVPLRFLICSRPEALIEETLDQFKDFTVRIDLAKLDDSNRDIEKYLVGQFSDIASKRGLNATWPGQGIIQEIVFKSSGNFILASTLIRYISDEDYSAQSQLDIIRNLKPPGPMSPFALLDELYLEILKRQRDQDFLKTFLALLVGYSSIEQDDLHKDDATLMNVSEEELHIKLRKMRSLIKLKPFIDVYHKSFLDFLQDSSRSGQYHVSKPDGQKRYLELIVRSVAQHVSMVIDQPDCHGECRSSPTFEYVVRKYPPKIALSIDDWREALKPLLDLQDKLLKTLRPRLCHITQVMRDLLLHLVILQRDFDHRTAIKAPELNMNEAVTELSPALVTAGQQNIPEKDLDSCLSRLLSCLQITDSVMVVDGAMIARISSLLTFDCAETAARVQSVLDAQKLIDAIDLLTNNKSFLSQCGPDAAHKAAHLASEIFARVPVLPRFLFSTGPTHHKYWHPTSRFSDIEVMCQSTFISRILDHNYVVPLLWQEGSWCCFVGVHVNVRKESVDGWIQRSRPTLCARIRVMLEIARIIGYIHSMDVALNSSSIRSNCFALDSKFRAKFLFSGLFTWWVREASINGYQYSGLLTDNTRDSNISAFAGLFHSVCFKGRKKIVSIRLVEDVKQLIERCRAKDPKSRPTMMDVVTEMETWDLT